MELRHLRYFLAVAEHQGFRKAAQSLCVSHPSLCEQIIDLETEIGTRLFERTSHHVYLTAAGHTFVTGARKTLKCALQAVETAQKASRENRGELRIANVGLMCSSILAQLSRFSGNDILRSRFRSFSRTISNGLKELRSELSSESAIYLASLPVVRPQCSGVPPSRPRRSASQWPRRFSMIIEARPSSRISPESPFSFSIRNMRPVTSNGLVRFSYRRDLSR